MDDVYQRRCRRLVRVAYPRRFRSEREDELLGLLLDLAEPGSDRLPRSVQLDVLAGGLWYRLRDRPPLLRWLLYRGFGFRLPPRWQSWVRDDINGRLWPWRRAATGGVPLLLLLFLAFQLRGLVTGAESSFPFGPKLIGLFFVLVALPEVIPAWRRRIRRTAFEYHGFTADGRPVVEPDPALIPHWTIGPAPREQIWPALVILGGTALVAAAAAGSALAARLPAASARIGVAVLAGTAVGVGLVLLVRARLVRRLRARPPEPDRAVVRWRPWALALAVAVAVGAAAGLVGTVVVAPEPDLGPLVAVVLGLVFGPAALVAGLVARVAEREAGLVVNMRDVLLSVLGDAEVIRPEPPIVVRLPLPAAAGETWGRTDR